MTDAADAAPFVIAPHYRWFLQWCRKRQVDPRQAHYIREPHQLHGMHGADIVIVDRRECHGAQLDAIRQAHQLECTGSAAVYHDSTRR